VIEVRMPKLGSGEVGTVLRWLVAEGDRVGAGDVLAEVETEKANTAVEAPTTGTVVALLVPADEEVDVGTVIARIQPPSDGAA
jgi:pyruvate/2-oxoglutarate dehydrogenase complex dihydrolipoamide acyltransferase (E2) component